jgi:hypothetical protein
MSIAAARRGFGFFVAIALGLAPSLAQPLPAAASTTGTLFAITGINQNVLSRIDPGTGVVTDIKDLGGVDQGQVVSLTGDPATHRLFAIRTTITPLIGKNELLTIDSQTFVVTPSPSTNVPAFQIQFDPSSGNLYGMGHDITGVVINRLDLATGTGTTLASLGQSPDILGMAVAPGLNTIYVNDFAFGSPPTSRILTINLLTSPATVTPSPTLPRPVRNIAYDSSSNVLVGTTEVLFGAPPVRDLVQIVPGSGAEPTTVPINDGSGIFTFAMTADPATHTVYLDIQYPIGIFTVEDHVYSINEAGVGQQPFVKAIGSQVWSLYFEPGNAPLDTSPPVTSIALAPVPNTAGWNNTILTVNLSATDPDGASDVATIHYSATGPLPIGETIVAGSSASFSLTAEGVTTITYFAVDKAGNSEATHAQVVRIDKTQPTITYTGNTGIYTVDQTVAITCTALDPGNANGTPGSGLASSTCANANAPAYSFGLGSHTLSASATDIAGNIGSGATSFTIQVTYTSLCSLTTQFIDSSAAFQKSPRLGRALGNLLCRLLTTAATVPAPAKQALVKAYQKGLTVLVAIGFLTPADSGILLTLSQAL